jgi:ABC-type hemin transport system ATPase subunit
VLCLKDGIIACHGPPSQILVGDRLAEVFGNELVIPAPNPAAG